MGLEAESKVSASRARARDLEFQVSQRRRALEAHAVGNREKEAVRRVQLDATRAQAQR